MLLNEGYLNVTHSLLGLVAIQVCARCTHQLKTLLVALGWWHLLRVYLKIFSCFYKTCHNISVMTKGIKPSTLFLYKKPTLNFLRKFPILGSKYSWSIKTIGDKPTTSPSTYLLIVQLGLDYRSWALKKVYTPPTTIAPSS